MILADGRHFDGPVTLTASAAVTFDEIAGIASDLTGRDIRRVVVDDEKWVIVKTSMTLAAAWVS